MNYGSTLTLKKLEVEERTKKSEAEVELKELQMRKKELEMYIAEIRELELSWNAVSLDILVEAISKFLTFDFSRHIKFVPNFKEKEVNKHFPTLRKWHRA